MLTFLTYPERTRLEKARRLMKRIIGKPFVSKHLLFIPSNFETDSMCEEPRYSFVNRMYYRTSLSEILRYEILGHNKLQFSFNFDETQLLIRIKLSKKSKEILFQDKLGSDQLSILSPNFNSEFQTELENGILFLNSINKNLVKSVIYLTKYHKSHSVRYTLNGKWIIIEFFEPQLAETPNKGFTSIGVKY